MLFRLIAKFHGSAIASGPVAVVHDGITIELRVDPASGRVNAMSLTTNADSALSELRRPRPPEGPIPTFRMPPAPRHSEMRELLQYLESAGSFWLGCENIGWGEPEFEWIPETEEESQLLDMTSAVMKREYQEELRVASPALLQYLLESRAALNRYIVPLAFYREGMREHRAKRYLYAFLNLYFFLEDLFADRKFRTEAVEAAFLGSEQLRRAMSYSLQNLGQPRLGGHLKVVRDMAKSVGSDLDVEGGLRALVRIRGRLHHFSSLKPGLKGHPLNQDELESLSVFMLGVCLCVVADLMPPAPVGLGVLLGEDSERA